MVINQNVLVIYFSYGQKKSSKLKISIFEKYLSTEFLNMNI